MSAYPATDVGGGVRPLSSPAQGGGRPSQATSCTGAAQCLWMWVWSHVLWAWLSLDTLLFLHTSPSPPHIPSSLPPSLLPDLHGYMTSHGMPDCPRSARYILKDYVKVSDNRRAVTVIETETESINWECLSTGKTVVLPPSSWIRPETVQQPPAEGGREGGEEGHGEKGRR